VSKDDKILLNNYSYSRVVSLLNNIQSIPQEQIHAILQTLIAGAIATLVGNAILVGSITSIVKSSSYGKKTNTLKAMSSSLPILPRLLIQISISTLLVQVGFMLLIVPGILLTILISLAPILLAKKNISIIMAIQDSFIIVWRNIGLVSPAIVLWLLARASVTLFVSLLPLPSVIIVLGLATIYNILYALLIIYLYRLLMLIE
jgi:hypothetical protein